MVSGPRLWNNLPVELRQWDICLSELGNYWRRTCFAETSHCDFYLSVPCTSTLTYLFTYYVAGVPVSARPSVARQSTLRSASQPPGAGVPMMQNGCENTDINEVPSQKPPAGTNIFCHYRAMHFSANARSWDRMSSVCPSVMLVICDHICWKSWKVIARSISPTPSLFAAERRST